MIGPRDIVWGLLLGVVGMLGLQSYPLWAAERLVASDAREAFLQTFEGRRMLDGTLIAPEGSTTAKGLPFTPPIFFRDLTVTAEQVDWNGQHVELVLRHVVGFDRQATGLNPTHDVFVQLEKQGGSFHCVHFEVRGDPPRPTPIEDNPWLPVMQSALHAERQNAGPETPGFRPVDHYQ